ncbi:hypothetical protein ACLESO_33350, partial [Pyxidicoccus sp. 3LG]
GAAAVLAQVQAATAPTASADALIATLTKAVQGPNGQTEEAAKGLWYLGEILYRGYKDLPADKVEEKVAALQSLEGIYTQAASLGYPEWAVGSLWKLALAYGHIADVVEQTPVPAGLSAAESQQFRAAVKEQVTPLKQRSEEAFKACLSRAESLEVFSAAVLGCRTRSETAALPVPQPAAPTQPAALEELRKKAERTLDRGDAGGPGPGVPGRAAVRHGAAHPGPRHGAAGHAGLGALRAGLGAAQHG